MLGGRISQLIRLSKFIGVFIFIIFFTETVEAKNYTVYVDANVTDNFKASAKPDCQNYNTTIGICGDGTESVYKTTRDVNAFILNLSTYDSAVIYFQRGDTWVIDASNEILTIDHSDIKIGAFATGNNPVFDGDNVNLGGYNGYPLIKITGGIKNITVQDLEIKNSYGNGIGLEGRSSIAGDVTIQRNKIHDIGWAAISCYGWQQNIGTITIENNEIYKTGEYCRVNGWSSAWPSAINYVANGVVRFNKVHTIYGEGIQAGTRNNLIEYNIVYNTRAPGIYIDGGSGFDKYTITRYNLVFGVKNPSPDYNAGSRNGKSWNSSGIWINKEKTSHQMGTIDVYGNLVIGCYSGIKLQNDTSGSSSITGPIKIYDNILIDNAENLLFNNSPFIKNVALKDNLSVVYDNAHSDNVQEWSGNPHSSWTIGANHWSSTPEDSSYYDTQTAVISDPKLPKKSGWTSLTKLSDFSYTDIHLNLSYVSTNALRDHHAIIFNSIFQKPNPIQSEITSPLGFKIKG